MEAHQIDGLSVQTIDQTAIDWFREHWQNDPDRRVDWDGDWNSGGAGGDFTIAVWRDGTLCGLASGELTKNAVRLDFVEGLPSQNPLKGAVVPIVLTVMNAYAHLTGRQYLRLNEVSPGLIDVYTRFGFELASAHGRVHVMQRKRI